MQTVGGGVLDAPNAPVTDSLGPSETPAPTLTAALIARAQAGDRAAMERFCPSGQGEESVPPAHASEQEGTGPSTPLRSAQEDDRSGTLALIARAQAEDRAAMERSCHSELSEESVLPAHPTERKETGPSTPLRSAQDDRNGTLALIAGAQAGDRVAMERLVEENLGLIRAVARRYQGRGVENDDLFQLASLGFLKAVAGYDPAFGTQFSTYAVPKIAGEIRRFLRDDGAVKVSRSLKERAVLIRQTRDRLAKSLGREPVLSELAEALELTAEEIAEAETAADPAVSIQQPAGDTGLSLESVLSDSPMEERLVERLALRQALDRLPEREARVVALRYYHGLTQDRTARLIGVSQVQVSRIEKKALAHLRELLE